jgi:hypothetical protein
MVLDIGSLKREQGLIETAIEELGDTDTKGPITDGVIDVEKYLNAQYRICWVLKEAYDGDGDKGGWPLGSLLGTDDVYGKFLRDTPSKKTWERVAYVTHALLHNFIPYREMNCIRNDPQMAQCLNQIAVVNVGKMPAATHSNDAGIAAKYEIWKPILHRQLNSYAPQIIIFGNTFQHFQSDLGIGDNELILYGNVKYAIKGKKLFIWAYHPAQWSIISKETYVQEIIDVVKENAANIA